MIRPATPEDVPEIHAMIGELAEFEKLSDQFVATAEELREALFGENPAAEAIVAEAEGGLAGYAIFFTTFSTFLAKPGLWLEDVYVRPALRGRGLGKS
ncbi:MAG: GNAT family N-acetyltransferase [Verrucomicrobiota bacterium]